MKMRRNFTSVLIVFVVTLLGFTATPAMSQTITVTSPGRGENGGPREILIDETLYLDATVSGNPIPREMYVFVKLLYVNADGDEEQLGHCTLGVSDDGEIAGDCFDVEKSDNEVVGGGYILRITVYTQDEKISDHHGFWGGGDRYPPSEAEIRRFCNQSS